MTHCRSENDEPSDLAMSGSATFTIVMSSSSMNTAVHTAPSVHQRSGSGSSWVLSGVGHVRGTVRRTTCSGMTQRHPTTPPQAPGPSGARPTVRPVLVRDFTDGQEVDQVLLVRAAEVRCRRDGSEFLRLVLGDRTGQRHGDGLGRRRGAQGALRGRRGGPRRRALRGPPALGRADHRARASRRAGRGQLRPGATCSTGRPRPAEQMEARPARARRHRPGPAPARAARRASSAEAPRPGQHYRRAPAAKHYHQAYRHGLLEHSLSRRAGRQRDQRDVPGHRPRRRGDRRAAARHRQARGLHGRPARAIDLTDAGRLQGEIPLGYYRVRRAIEDIDGLPARAGAGRAAHHPQPPRLARARQPGRARARARRRSCT